MVIMLKQQRALQYHYLIICSHTNILCACVYIHIYIDIYAYSWKSSEFRWNTKCTFVLQGRLVRTGPLCNLTQDTTWSIASVTYNPFAENVWRILNKCFLRRTTKNQRLTLKKIYMNMVIIVMLKKISLHRVLYHDLMLIQNSLSPLEGWTQSRANVILSILLVWTSLRREERLVWQQTGGGKTQGWKCVRNFYSTDALLCCKEFCSC